MNPKRLQLWAYGRIQGVGFRPYVYRLAKKHQLIGSVANHPQGVCIEVQGVNCDLFTQDLQKCLPPLARINKLDIINLPINHKLKRFTILESKQGIARTSLPADTCLCSDCLNELMTPTNRYYQYPFLNCMHCGPRFSITHALPYDRQQTSMRDFILCDNCKAEYEDPNSRRYHAEPIACAKCGPMLTHTIEEMVTWLQQGQIITVKTLGSYQWIVNAHDDKAIHRLRELKQRPSKPLSIMMLNTSSAKIYAHVNQLEKNLLEHNSRPITLLKMRKPFQLPPTLAPNLQRIGIMLPSTALHYLLFQELIKPNTTHNWLNEVHQIALVVTSANIANEPLIYENSTAQSLMAKCSATTKYTTPIVDHPRNIVSPIDDSVIQASKHGSILIRRGRGFVLDPIELAHDIMPTIGLGGQDKTTFCVTRKNEAFVSQHLGSLDQPSGMRQFHATLKHFLKFLNIKPERWVHDQHPNFSNSQWIAKQKLTSVAIQHHHAHLASVVAEHHLCKPVLGLALDGSGYGSASQIWGGELLKLENATMQRLGHFFPLNLLGGELAIKDPRIMANSVLQALDNPTSSYKLTTSSCGRLFDAISVFAGIKIDSYYDGQAAMRLEQCVTQPEVYEQGWNIKNGVISFLPLCQFLLTHPKATTTDIANIFHGTLIAGLIDWIEQAAHQHKIQDIVLAGGCFLNTVLTDGLIHALNQQGLTTYLPRQLPPNDGGLSLGQAWLGGNILCV